MNMLMKAGHKSGTIAMFMPSGPAGRDRIAQGLSIMEADGITFNLQMPDREPERVQPFPWLYTTDAAQARDFTTLMQRRDAVFAWAVRGGYGILRWLGSVDWDSATENSPLVTGYSDLTALHAALNARGIRSLHAPMLCTLASTSTESRRALWNCFSQGKIPALQGNPACPGSKRGPVTVHARIIGGNLCTLVHLVGTPWEPPWQGNILFLEDHNEPLYKIDRMLTHLLQSGRLRQVAAVAAGEFSCTDAPDEMLRKLLADRLGPLGIPVLTGIPAGHGRNNMPVLMGGRYLLDMGACRLTPLESPTETVSSRDY